MCKTIKKVIDKDKSKHAKAKPYRRNKFKNKDLIYKVSEYYD